MIENVTTNSGFFRFAIGPEQAKAVRLWLIIGLVMVFLQIFIGGVTRLTGSGLSITRWEVVSGTIPPLSSADWQEAFDLYRETPQYQKINRGMSMSEFQFIYFWEYFHRLWARLMFFVFIIPFAYFLLRGSFTKRIMPRLLMVIFLAGLEGFFGWAMVKSGLRDRPWVNAYNLLLHLMMGLSIYSYLLWTIFTAYAPKTEIQSRTNKKAGWILVTVTFVQIALGALMSGTKAALFFPTWPDMHGTYFPAVLLDTSNWIGENFLQYDTQPFMPALVQFLHRNVAYLLTVLILVFVIRRRSVLTESGPLRFSTYTAVGLLFLQVLLGILTLLNSRGSIPVLLGVLHQAVAVLLLSAVLGIVYYWKGDSPKWDNTPVDK